MLQIDTATLMQAATALFSLVLIPLVKTAVQIERRLARIEAKLNIKDEGDK